MVALSPFVLLLIYIATGIVAGILGGMLGIGGGVITVPVLFGVFTALRVPHSLLMHMAIGTSLAAIVFNALASTWSFHRRHLVLWKLFFKLTPSFFVGAIAGAILAHFLTEKILAWIFAAFLFAFAMYFWCKKGEAPGTFPIPSLPLLSFIGACIGCLSSLLGIGGGTLAAPFFQMIDLPVRQTLGTAAASSLFLSLVGSGAYLYIGWEHTHWPRNVGYIDLDAFLVIGVASMFVAHYGVSLGQRMPMVWVRRIFSIVFIATGLGLILMK